MDTYSPISSISNSMRGGVLPITVNLGTTTPQPYYQSYYHPYNGMEFIMFLIFVVIIVVLFIISPKTPPTEISSETPFETPSEKPIITSSTKEENGNIKEHMSAGTLTQLFAVDAQNKAINGDVDQTATGNYNLYWGQPTRVASTYPNRGQLLPATVIPKVAAQQNGNNPNKLDINLNYNQTYSQQLDQKVNKLVNYLDNTENKNYGPYLQQNCGENCYTNPQACGNGAGGYRLGSDFVEPSTAKPFITLQGNTYYPDQYNGSYWIAPKPDIMKPLPVIGSGLYPLNNNFNNY